VLVRSESCGDLSDQEFVECLSDLKFIKNLSDFVKCLVPVRSGATVVKCLNYRKQRDGMKKRRKGERKEIC
jgi:hypothetical protein